MYWLHDIICCFISQQSESQVLNGCILLYFVTYCMKWSHMVTNGHMLSQSVMFFRECRLGAGNSWRSGNVYIIICCYMLPYFVPFCMKLSHFVTNYDVFLRECRLGAGNSWRSGVMCIDCTSSPPSLSGQTNEHTQTHPLHIDRGEKYKLFI